MTRNPSLVKVRGKMGLMSVKIQHQSLKSVSKEALKLLIGLWKGSLIINLFVIMNLEIVKHYLVEY